MVFTSYQSLILKDTERVSSAFSLIGSCFIFTTFLTSKAFRKPINRIIVYASMGNTLMNIATLISVNGVLAGKGSSLCQFQAFLVQMSVSLLRKKRLAFLEFTDTDCLHSTKQVLTSRRVMEPSNSHKSLPDPLLQLQCQPTPLPGVDILHLHLRHHLPNSLHILFHRNVLARQNLRASDLMVLGLS